MSDAVLFAFAVNHRFSMEFYGGEKAQGMLEFSHHYVRNFNCTRDWAVPYHLDDKGLPVFTAEHRETLRMLLSGEHMLTMVGFTDCQVAPSDAGNPDLALIKYFTPL